MDYMTKKDVEDYENRLRGVMNVSIGIMPDDHLSQRLLMSCNIWFERQLFGNKIKSIWVKYYDKDKSVTLGTTFKMADNFALIKWLDVRSPRFVIIPMAPEEFPHVMMQFPEAHAQGYLAWYGGACNAWIY